MANTNARSIKIVWVNIRIFLLFSRSAKTPPNNDRRNIGIELKKPTSPKRKAELVNSKTSQLWATCWIQVPIKETNIPIQ
jgi:hypothetical protein